MLDKQDSDLLIIANRIRTNDAEADRIGAKLAAVLRCKRDPEHRDRWVTGWGTKTNTGLARTLIATLEAEADIPR